MAQQGAAPLFRGGASKASESASGLPQLTTDDDDNDERGGSAPPVVNKDDEINASQSKYKNITTPNKSAQITNAFLYSATGGATGGNLSPGKTQGVSGMCIKTFIYPIFILFSSYFTGFSLDCDVSKHTFHSL